MKVAQVFKFTLLSLCLSQVFADEAPIYLGKYASEKARTTTTGFSSDFSKFSIVQTPYNEIVAEFTDYDLELEIKKDLTFGGEASECQDPGCYGVGYVSGKIFFEEVEGALVPKVKLKLDMYADGSEDVDCEEVDCDNMDASDYFEEWSEEYIYEFEGSFPNQTPSFAPVALSQKLVELAQSCKTLIRRVSYLNCFQFSEIKILKDLDNDRLAALKSFNDMIEAKAFSVEQTREFLKKQIELDLLKYDMFEFSKYDNFSKEKYLAIFDEVIKTYLSEQDGQKQVFLKVLRPTLNRSFEKLSILIVDQNKKSALRIDL